MNLIVESLNLIVDSLNLIVDSSPSSSSSGAGRFRSLPGIGTRGRPSPGIRRPSATPPSYAREACAQRTAEAGPGWSGRTRGIPGGWADDVRRRGWMQLDATRRRPIRRCCCSRRGMPSAPGASPRSRVAARRPPTRTCRAGEIWAHPLARRGDREATAGRSVRLSAGGWAIETHARAARWVIRRCARP